MSTAVNSYSITRNNVQIPYVTSACEIGFFGNIGNAGANIWNSMPIVMQSNNGLSLANADGCGLTILAAGIYKLSIGVNVQTTGGNTPNTISFAFGTAKLSNNNNAPTGLLGGALTTSSLNGMYSFGGGDYSNSGGVYPGIISWITNAYSGSNNTSSRLGLLNNCLVYEFFSYGTNSGVQYPGICTSELTFVTNNPVTIYFNAACDKGNFTMGRSYFTLQMLSSQFVV